MSNSMDAPTRFFHKLARGLLVGFAAAMAVAFLSGLSNVPKADAMAYTFYLGLLVGLTSFIVPVREKKGPPTAG